MPSSTPPTDATLLAATPANELLVGRIMAALLTEQVISAGEVAAVETLLSSVAARAGDWIKLLNQPAPTPAPTSPLTHAPSNNPA
jgi:hypothetical protein